MNIQTQNSIYNAYSPTFNGLGRCLSKCSHKAKEARLDKFIGQMADIADKRIENIDPMTVFRCENIKLQPFPGSDTTINSWLIRSVMPSDKFYLFFHGGTSNVTNYQHFYKNRATVESVNYLAVEFPGYPTNRQIKPTRENIEATAKSAYDYLVNELHIAPENINILGYCFGSPIATKLASKVKCNSLTLISPVTAFSQINNGYLKSKNIRLTLAEKIEKLLAKTVNLKPKSNNIFNIYSDIKDVNCPLYIMSSTNDPVTDIGWIDKLVNYVLKKGKRVTYLKGFEEGHKLDDFKSQIIAEIVQHKN